MPLFRDPRLRRLFLRDDPRGLPPPQVERIRRILGVLTSVTGPRALRDHPEWRPHPLKRDLKGFWAVDVSARNRIIFQIEDGRATDIQLTDYHRQETIS